MDHKKRGFKEINIKNITCVELSRGGDKIAIAAGNPQLIYVYKFWDCERINQTLYKGHSGKITTLKFHQNGISLFSAGTDGIVYEWNLLTD